MHSRTRLFEEHRIISKPPAFLSLEKDLQSSSRYSSGEQSILQKVSFFSPRPASSNISRSLAVDGAFIWFWFARHTKLWVHVAVESLGRFFFGSGLVCFESGRFLYPANFFVCAPEQSPHSQFEGFQASYCPLLQLWHIWLICCLEITHKYILMTHDSNHV